MNIFSTSGARDRLHLLRPSYRKRSSHALRQYSKTIFHAHGAGRPGLFEGAADVFRSEVKAGKRLRPQ